MASTSASASVTMWRPLPTFPDLPALLVRPSFNVETSSYSLQVTDLAHIWTECLDRKGILKRSLNEDTSIDLSDGDREQWRVFLSKLEAAFDPTSPDHEHTSLTLSPHHGKSGGPDDLALHITCVLPKPLEPLKWPVYLTRGQPNALASDLVVPLVQATRARTQEVEYLLARLREKDAVIDRVLDKLQAVGTGLENVFHPLPIKRKATRAAAEEKVPGLARFNETGWRSQLPPDDGATYDNVSSLINDAFGNATLGVQGNGIKVSEVVNDWWRDFNPASAVIKPKAQAAAMVSSTPEEKKRSGDSDDDFQIRATPPSARKNRHRKQPTARKDGDTTDEDHSDVEIPDSLPKKPDDEPPPARPRLGVLGGKKAPAAAGSSSQVQSQSQSSRTVPNDDDETASESEDISAKPSAVIRQPSGKGVGTVGGRKQARPTPPPPQTPPPQSPPPAPVAPSNPKDDDETASDSDSDAGAKPQSSRAAAPAPAQEKRGGLGRIGGRSRATPTPAPEENGEMAGPSADAASTATPATDVTATSKRPRRGLGAIGKQVDSGSGNKGDDGPSASTAASAAEASEEEAKKSRKPERKRAEISKEPDKKVAAPVKKKRRF